MAKRTRSTPKKGKTGCGLFDTHVGEHTKKQGKSVCGSSRKPQREWWWFGAAKFFYRPGWAENPRKSLNNST